MQDIQRLSPHGQSPFEIATLTSLCPPSSINGTRAMLGLENLVVLAGDAFSERDRSQATAVADFRPTELIASIAAMNMGTDYKGSRLRCPTDFCIGASIDLTCGVAREARLAHRKAQAGAHFFLAQPIFWGVQVLEKNGVIFSSVPPEVRRELEAGQPGTDIALALLRQVFDAG